MTDSNNPRGGVMQFLESHLDYRIKLLITALVIAGMVYSWNRLRDLERQHSDDVKRTATLEQKFETLGATVVTRNEAQSKADVQQQAVQLLGQQTVAYMRANNARIQSMTTAIGQVAGSVSGLQDKLNTAAFAQHQDAATGALAGYTLEEARAGKPALAAVRLSYDPRQRDPNAAFLGTTWTHYSETFKPVLGDWVQDKTGALKTTIRLSRTIARPDGSVVGSEDIPITDATTIYAPSALVKQGGAPATRWTASLGVSQDAGGRYGVQPSATLDYRVSSKYGVWAGAVNRSPAVGVSVRF